MEWALNMFHKIEDIDNIPNIEEIHVKSLIEGIRTLRSDYADATILRVKTNQAHFIAIKCDPQNRPRFVKAIEAVVTNKKLLHEKITSISSE
jgi:hypothetical protein